MKKMWNVFRASCTNLDGITRTVYRVQLFGVTILKWNTIHGAVVNDWK